MKPRPGFKTSHPCVSLTGGLVAMEWSAESHEDDTIMFIVHATWQKRQWLACPCGSAVKLQTRRTWGRAGKDAMNIGPRSRDVTFSLSLAGHSGLEFTKLDLSDTTCSPVHGDRFCVAHCVGRSGQSCNPWKHSNSH